MKSIISLIGNAPSIILIGPQKLEKYCLNSKSFVLFVDGGTKHRKHFLQNKNQFSLGDGDSSKVTLDKTISPIKNFSDLAYALSFIKGFKGDIFLDGFFPKLRFEQRIDHLFSNLGEVYFWVHKYSVKVVLNQNIIIFPSGIHEISVLGSFSLFTIFKSKVRLTGKCQYKMLKTTKLLPLSSLGLSNIGHGQLKIETNKPIILYLEGTKVK